MQFVPGDGFYLKGRSLAPYCSRGSVAGPLLCSYCPSWRTKPFWLASSHALVVLPPDLCSGVGGPQHVSSDAGCARLLQPPGSLFTLHSGARKSPAVCVIKTKRGWCLRSAYHLREPLSSAFYAFFSELHVDSLSRGLIVPLNKGCGCWVLGWLHNFLPAEP